MNALELGTLNSSLFEPETYGSLRAALIRYFEWNNAQDPANLADEVFCRLVKSITVQTDVKSMQAFAYGIAQNVLREYRRERDRERNLSSESYPESTPPLHQAFADNLNESLAEDLEECLKCLTKQERSLIQAFYGAEGSKKIQQRKKLADKLGISQNALRIRVSRLRKKLADCIEERQRLKNASGSGRPPRKS